MRTSILLACLLVVLPAFADDAAPRRVRDLTKSVVIEKPIELVLRNTHNAQEPVAETSLVQRVPVSKDLPEAEADNPATEPGKVVWRAGFDAACRSAAESGKPVLLFQLLGRLDQTFT